MGTATSASIGYVAQGGYTVPTEVISAAAQVQVLAQITKLIDLIGGEPMSGRVLDGIHPVTRDMLQVEGAALKTAIDAAPTA